jgi:D-sedoheptulose 7-phosphate isomerase
MDRALCRAGLVPYNAEKKIMARLKDYLEASRAALAVTIDGVDEARIERAIAAITSALSKDKPLLICGNGGSAADAMHIAGELVGRYLKERRGLKAIALSSDPAVLTAWSNDYGYDTVFARQVEALGEKGGVLLAISTSGNSKNVIAAAKAAKKKGMTVVGLTGKGGGKLGLEADILLDVPATATPLIQQIHICLYHFICSEIEERISRA